RARGREDNVRDSFDLSLSALPDDDPAGDRERYLRLGVFPSGTPFPPRAAGALWGCGEAKADELLLDLAGQALLSPQGPPGARRYAFHDLLHEFVIDRLGERRLAEAHGALVDGYRGRAAGGWHTAPDDGYFFEHL